MSLLQEYANSEASGTILGLVGMVTTAILLVLVYKVIKKGVA